LVFLIESTQIVDLPMVCAVCGHRLSFRGNGAGAGRVALAGVPENDPARGGPASHASLHGVATGQAAAACGGTPTPANFFSTFFTSLRMPKPEMISTTPSTISQMPTTSANVTIESKG